MEARSITFDSNGKTLTGSVMNLRMAPFYRRTRVPIRVESFCPDPTGVRGVFSRRFKRRRKPCESTCLENKAMRFSFMGAQAASVIFNELEH